MVDGQDLAKKWYQCVIVEERDDEDGGRSVKVTSCRRALACVCCQRARRVCVSVCCVVSQISFLGWGSRFDEWLPVTSPRVAKLNSRSRCMRGMLVADVAVFDQELVVSDDAEDPDGVIAVLRKGVRRSTFLVENMNVFFGVHNGAGIILQRLAKMDLPLALEVRTRAAVAQPHVLLMGSTRGAAVRCGVIAGGHKHGADDGQRRVVVLATVRRKLHAAAARAHRGGCRRRERGCAALAHEGHGAGSDAQHARVAAPSVRQARNGTACGGLSLLSASASW
jgi:hypothetical protein